MALLDILKQAFQSGGNQLAASQAGAQQGLPPLQGAFEDYGPWGAGGAPNPFARAVMAQNPAPMFPPTPQETGRLQPPPEAAQATLSQKSPMSYNPLLDPQTGALSTIGSLMGAPTRQEDYARREGVNQSNAAIALKQLIAQNGGNAQQAVFDYISSPEGKKWFMDATPGSDPVAEIKQIVSALVPPAKDDYTLGKERRSGNTNAVLATAPEDPYSLSPGEQRRGPNNEVIAENPAKQPDPIQEYEYYAQQEKAAGREPKPYGDFDIARRRSTVESGATSADGTLITPDWQKEQIRLYTVADQDKLKTEAFDRAQGLANGANTDWITGATLPLRQALASIGLLGEEDVANANIQKLLETMSNQMALAIRGSNDFSGTVGLTGNTSDRDLSFLQNSTFSIWNTPQANEAIIILSRAQARRQGELSALKADYIGQHGNLKGWNEFSDQWSKTHDALDATDKKTLLELNHQAELSGGGNLDRPMPGGSGKQARTVAPMPDTFLTDVPNGPVKQRAWENFVHSNRPKAEPNPERFGR